MGYIDDLKSTLADAFSAFPILIAGFTFLFGVFTSNTGLLYLFLGQLFLVPVIGFLTNLYKRPWFKEDGTSDIGGSVKTLLGLFAIFRTNTLSENYGTFFGISTFFLLLLQFLLNGKYPPSSTMPACGMLPTETDESVYSTPSMWVLHLCFFIFFLIANARAIYDLPAPEITKFQDKDTLQSRKERLEARITTRKSQAIMVMGVSIILLLGLLTIRFSKTDCEKGFWLTLPAIILISMTGYNYFNALVEYCGIRPADVLGIVSGIINPDLADNPIVCVGE